MVRTYLPEVVGVDQEEGQRSGRCRSVQVAWGQGEEHGGEGPGAAAGFGCVATAQVSA